MRLQVQLVSQAIAILYYSSPFGPFAMGCCLHDARLRQALSCILNPSAVTLNILSKHSEMSINEHMCNMLVGDLHTLLIYKPRPASPGLPHPDFPDLKVPVLLKLL